MARKKISELPLDTAVIGTDVVPIVSDGATKRVQLATLGTYFSTVPSVPSSHAASHGQGGSDEITVAVGQVTGLQAALDSKLSGTDASVTNAREWSASTVSQADAEAGTSTSRFAFTPLRVFQAIAAWWAASSAKTKLDGIATGATANATDAQLRDRSTHTGTQLAATISDFASAVVAAAPPTTNASLLASGTLPDARLSSNIARTSDVSSAVAAVVNAAPAALDTLNELAAALGNDASFATTVTNALAGKAAAVHTHVIADVTGLQTALDGKQASGSYAAAVHTHGISDVTGLQTALDGKQAAGSYAAAVHGHAIADVTGLQTALDGKQAAGSYAAAVHTHGISDVTGLQTALDGKAASSHTHTASAISDFASAAVSAVTWTTLTGKPTFATVATSGAYSDLTGTPAAYSLPTASGSVLGGVKIGSGLSIDGSGVLTATYSYSLPVATASVLGGVKQGSNVTIGVDGTISVAAPVTSLPYSSITGTPTLATVATSGSAADLTGTLSASRLPSTAVTPGSYGSASAVATYTVDGTGRLTAAGSTSIAIAAGAVSGLASVATAGTFASLSSTPTTLSGYGITDAVASNDARLSDSRTPTSGSVTDSSITSGGLSASSINWVAIAPWAANTAYAKGDLVSYLGVAYRRGAAGTSGATFNTANWQQVTPSEFVGSQITSGTVPIARLGTGSPSASNFLRGDGTFAAAGSTNASDLVSGTLAYSLQANPTVTSPSQITASQNDYASFARGINRFTTNAARDITGMVAGADGEVRVLCNVGTTAANTLTIKDQSTSSTAANRFAVPWAGDCVVPAGGSVVVFYDNTTARWRVV